MERVDIFLSTFSQWYIFDNETFVSPGAKSFDIEILILGRYVEHWCGMTEAEPAIEPHFELEDDTQSALAAAVESLPRDQREVLVLKIWNDLTFSEIADSLGISQNTAASRYRYALTNLKKTLQPQ